MCDMSTRPAVPVQEVDRFTQEMTGVTPEILCSGYRNIHELAATLLDIGFEHDFVWAKPEYLELRSAMISRRFKGLITDSPIMPLRVNRKAAGTGIRVTHQQRRTRVEMYQNGNRGRFWTGLVLSKSGIEMQSSASPLRRIPSLSMLQAFEGVLETACTADVGENITRADYDALV